MGIVSDVTGLVIEQGGNVGESFSGRLGDAYFSLMMLVQDIEDPEKLQASIRNLPGLDSAVFQVGALESGSSKVSPQVACTCLLYGFSVISHAVLTMCCCSRPLRLGHLYLGRR